MNLSERQKGYAMEPKIEPVDGQPCCYLVYSESRIGKKHEVNLLLFSGNGYCSCENFEHALLKNCEFAMVQRGLLKSGIKMSDIPNWIKLQRPDTRCKHIKLAIRKWANDTLRIMNQMTQEDEQYEG